MDFKEKCAFGHHSPVGGGFPAGKSTGRTGKAERSKGTRGNR